MTHYSRYLAPDRMRSGGTGLDARSRRGPGNGPVVERPAGHDRGLRRGRPGASRAGLGRSGALAPRSRILGPDQQKGHGNARAVVRGLDPGQHLDDRVDDVRRQVSGLHRGPSRRSRCRSSRTTTPPHLDYWYRMPTIVGPRTAIRSWPSGPPPSAATSGTTTPGCRSPRPEPRVSQRDRAQPRRPSRPVNLSRTPGKVRFRFIDDTSAWDESPTTGEGPTIDDVTVSGYKYGPVRGLHTTSVSADSVGLAWTRAGSRPRRSALRTTRGPSPTTCGALPTPSPIRGPRWGPASPAPRSSTRVAQGGTWRYIVGVGSPVRTVRRTEILRSKRRSPRPCSTPASPEARSTDR